jgi:hypothetical protein
MMMFSIDEDKVPIKFILGIERELEGFPAPIDIMHYVVSLCWKHPSRYKGSFTKHHCMTYWFKDCDETILDKSLNKLVQTGYISETNRTPGKEGYKIIKNPFK